MASEFKGISRDGFASGPGLTSASLSQLQPWYWSRSGVRHGLHHRSGTVSLRHRWQSLMHRWANYVVWPCRDFFRDFDAPAVPKRSRKALLDVLPLEDRQMPSFGISLFANAAPDPLQGTYSAVGRTNVGLHDGNAQLNIPIDIFRSDSGGPTALIYNSNTVKVKPIVAVQVTSLGSDRSQRRSWRR